MELSSGMWCVQYTKDGADTHLVIMGTSDRQHVYDLSDL